MMMTPNNAKTTVMPWVLKEPAAKAFFIVNRPTNVASLLTMMCASCRPMKVMNRPIPTETATFSCAGMALKIASLTFVMERMMKMMPSINTAVNAACQE